MKSVLLVILYSLVTVLLTAQNNPRNLDLKWKTDTTNQQVPLLEFTALMIRDGIPPIDKPTYWSKKGAEENLFSHEPVISLIIGDKARAYPLSILMWHEIVNDFIDDTYYTVTYCPLCNAAIIFDRKITVNNKNYLLDFGVSGMLRNSDLVMWDRQTESWWQQFTGTALVGELAGAELSFLSSQLISLQEFLENYPEGQVLSTDTGFEKKYGTNPYISYDDPTNLQPRLFKGTVDNRLPAMERVIDISFSGKRKIYPLSKIQELYVINDRFEEKDIVIFYTAKTVSALDQSEIAQSKSVGSVTVFHATVDEQKLEFRKKGKNFTDIQSQSTWNITGACIAGPYKGKKLTPVIHGNHFAFAWLTFHPDSEIYR